MFVFYNKYCVNNSKYMFIVVKIKYMNSNNINDICNKFNFTTNYTQFIRHIFYKKKNISYKFLHKWGWSRPNFFRII